MRSLFIPLALFVAFNVTGCGGGGGSSTTASNYTGQYLDAPTVGLKYTASPSGLTGTTDSNGYFQFKAGDTVTFVIDSPAGDIPAGATTPATPATTSTVAVVQVLTLENGPVIAQTLQSLGGTGATIDVSRTSTNVAGLTASEVTSIKDYVNSGGVTTAPAKLTVDKDTALANAAATIANVEKRASSSTIKDALSGVTVAAIGVTSLTGINAKLRDLSIANYKTDGTVNSLCLYTSTIVNTTGQNYGTSCSSEVTQATWTSSTSDSSSFSMTFPSGQTNTISAPSYSNNSGVYTLTGTNISFLPNGLTGTGVYKVLKSDLKASQIAGKTITVSGIFECSDGKMNFAISTDGTSFTKSCKTSPTLGSQLLCPTGTVSDMSSIPGLIKLAGGACTISTPIYYFGITTESTISSGTAVVVTYRGTANCGPDNIACGKMGLFTYASQ